MISLDSCKGNRVAVVVCRVAACLIGLVEASAAGESESLSSIPKSVTIDLNIVPKLIGQIFWLGISL